MIGELFLSASLMLGSPSVSLKASSSINSIKRCSSTIASLFDRVGNSDVSIFSVVDDPKLFKDSLKCGLYSLYKKDDQGRTVFHYIAMKGDPSVLDNAYNYINGSNYTLKHSYLSKEWKRPLDIPDKNGRTPFFYAMMSKNWGVAKRLLEHGVNFNYTDHEYVAPIAFALKYDNFDMVKTLVDRGASFDSNDDHHRSLLVYPILHKRMDILKYIIENAREVDISYLDDNYWSPIMYATRYKNYEALEYLLKKGSNPNYREKKYYRSPLIWAIIDNDRRAIEILLKYGASPEEADLKGRDAFWYANRYGVPLKGILRSIRNE